MTDHQVLGPMRVIDAGADVAIRGARERALLVRLLLDAGRTVLVAALVADLWPPEQQAAPHSLQVGVSSLRRDLAGRDAIERTGDGYRCRPRSWSTRPARCRP